MQRLQSVLDVNAAITNWLNKPQPANLPPSYNPESAARSSPGFHNYFSPAAFIQPAAPVQQVIIQNGNPAPILRSRQTSQAKEEDEKLSSAQVIGAAVVGTATVAGVAWLWFREEDLEELQLLRSRVSFELEELKQVAASWPRDLISFEFAVLTDTLSFLDMEISHRNIQLRSKIGGTGLAGATVVGSVLSAGFLTSWTGIGAIAGCCGLFLVGLVDYFSTSSTSSQKRRTHLRQCIGSTIFMFEVSCDRIQREQEEELANSQRAYQDFKY